MGSKNPRGAKKKKNEKMNENRPSSRGAKIKHEVMYFATKWKNVFCKKEKKEKIWNEMINL